MLIPKEHLHRLAALALAVFGFYVFLKGVSTDEYKVLEDGSLVDATAGNLVCFRQSRTVLTFRAGFDVYRSICYGASSLFLFLDLFLNSGHLSLPALVLAAGEIVNDVSDFSLAVVLIAVYIGGYPAAAYGLMYLALLVLEVAVWLGTCKFHENCRLANFESSLLRQKQEETNSDKMRVS